MVKKPAHVNTTMEWHQLDASTVVLGRLATQVAGLLMGKHRSDWTANKVAPVQVVITNTDKLVVTGNKKEQKMYRWFTGYPGGLKERPLGEQIRRDSRVVVRQAVSGMLPKNKLRDRRLRQLKLYAGHQHPHQAQFSKVADKPES